MHPTQNDMSLEVRKSVADLLNARLADVIALSLQAKQAHWNVKGSTFMALHKLFDDLYGVLIEATDEIAERIVAVGGTAKGTARNVASNTSLPAYPLDIVSGRDHCRAVSAAIALVGKLVRADIDEMAKQGDADSADLLTGLSRDLDKYLWFVEAHLQAD